VEPTLQHPAVGDTVPDWGGRDAGLTVALLQPPTALVHTSVRGATGLSWALVLRPATGGTTRMHLRLRLAPVRRRRLVRAGGGLLDELTVAALAAGLRERLRDRPGGA
jgi:hypothetical protein